MSVRTVGIVGDLRSLDGFAVHMVGDKYARAIAEHADAIPVLIPCCISPDQARALCGRLDGFLFTGSASNIEPHHWNGPADAPGPFDPARDNFSLNLVRLAIALEKPSLFICRGLQELNVALGGTLHASVADVPGRNNHHAPENGDTDVSYGPFHQVILREDSPLMPAFGATRFLVNSLHYQALDQVSPELVVEGRAPDGTVEVVHVPAHPFAVGVQWHPEYRPELYPENRSLLRAFGRALRAETRLVVK